MCVESLGPDPISGLAVLIDTQYFGQVETLEREWVSATVLNTGTRMHPQSVFKPEALLKPLSRKMTTE